MSDQSFLDEHRATLSPVGSGWALRYQVASYEYGSRLEESVDCEIPIVERNYNFVLMIARIILHEHVAPGVSEPEAHPMDTAGTPDGPEHISWARGGVNPQSPAMSLKADDDGIPSSSAIERPVRPCARSLATASR